MSGEIGHAFPPKWDTLRSLGQSRIVSLTILAPFIGYFIIFNEYISRYLQLSADAIGIYSGDINAFSAGISRLRQLYIGLVLIGLASILFKTCCPAIISRHRDLYEYVESELKIMSAERFTSIQTRLRRLRSWGRVEWQERIDRALNTTLQHYRKAMAEQHPLVWEGWINENRLSLTAVLTIAYKLENDARVIARWFIAVFYIIGFLFLAWPSLRIFINVMHSLI
jgi:hypothetical protein